jgi:acetolactate synthase-1/2/3 large subunit
MARSMGADGVTVEAPGDLAGALDAALAAERPTVLDVRVDADAAPPAPASWELPPLPHPEPTIGWHES